MEQLGKDLDKSFFHVWVHKEDLCTETSVCVFVCGVCLCVVRVDITQVYVQTPSWQLQLKPKNTNTRVPHLTRHAEQPIEIRLI